MKNRIIYLFTVLLISSLGFTGCENDMEGPLYKLDNKDYVSFQSKIQTFEVDENSKVRIYLAHANKNITTTKAKIALVANEEGTEDIFTLSSNEVSFGNNPLVPIEILFNINKLEFKKNYTLTLQIADNGATSYPLGSDIKETTITIKRTLTFTYVGTGLYSSDLTGGEAVEVDIMRADQSPNVYRLSGFYKNPIELIIDPEKGVATIDPQDLGEDLFGDVGTNSWIWCKNGIYSNGVCTFGGGIWDNAWFTDNNFESGLPMENEVIALPAGSY